MIMSMNEWMISGKKLRERRHNNNIQWINGEDLMKPRKIQRK